MPPQSQIVLLLSQRTIAGRNSEIAPTDSLVLSEGTPNPDFLVPSKDT